MYMCVIYTYLSCANTKTKYVLCVFPPQKVVRVEDLLECHAPCICVCHLYMSIIRRYQHRMYSMRVFATHVCIEPMRFVRRTCSDCRLYIYMCIIYTYLSYTHTNTKCILCLFSPQKVLHEELLKWQALYMCVMYTYPSYTKTKKGFYAHSRAREWCGGNKCVYVILYIYEYHIYKPIIQKQNTRILSVFLSQRMVRREHICMCTFLHIEI